MIYRRLGASGLKVSAVSFGSWLTVGNTVAQRDTDALVRTAFDRGVNLFDTADVYNTGEGELALGRALDGLPRHELVIASKCFFPMSDDVNDRGLSRKHIHESIDKSLRRIGVDYLDLYQCHRPDEDTPLRETAQAMHDVVTSGKALYWGVSEWPGYLIARAVDLCERHGWHPPISNQPCYNLLERTIEREVVPAGDAVGVGQIVFSPLAQGVLTGKYRPGGEPGRGTRAADQRVKHFIARYMDEDSLGRVQRLVSLAQGCGCTPAQLALAWCLDNDAVASVIVGATRVEQLEDNLGAIDVALDDSIRQALAESFPA